MRIAASMMRLLGSTGLILGGRWVVVGTGSERLRAGRRHDWAE